MYRKIKIFKHQDSRGKFSKLLDDKKIQIKQVFFSNSKKNVFRGFHYYGKQNKSKRYIYVLKGEIDDYIVDLRSKNFGKVYKKNIKENDNFLYLLPEFCAHAFLCKSNATVIYFFENKHLSRFDYGINPKSILKKINKKMILSKRDLNHPNIFEIDKF